MLLSVHVTLLDWGVATAGLNESLKTDTLTTCTCSTNAPNPITKNAEKSCQKYVVLKHFEKKGTKYGISQVPRGVRAINNI